MVKYNPLCCNDLGRDRVGRIYEKYFLPKSLCHNGLLRVVREREVKGLTFSRKYHNPVRE